MSKFTNVNLLMEVLELLEEIKKKLANNNNSTDEGGDDSFNELERVMTKVQEEVKPEKNLLGKEKDWIKIELETFTELIKRILELFQFIYLRKVEELKELQRYIKSLEFKVIDLENENKSIYRQKEKNEKDKIIIKEAKNVLNQYVQNNAKIYVEEIIKRDYPHLKDLEKQRLKEEIERKAIQKAKEEELAHIREAEMIAEKYEREMEMDDDFER